MRIGLLATTLLCFWGCSTNRPNPLRSDWHHVNIHKVLVVCVQGNHTENRRLESILLPKLRRQGFDAIGALNLLADTSNISARKIFDAMRRARVDGIMEITYSAVDGLPRLTKFKYHDFKRRTGKLSNDARSLDDAIIELLARK
jgi:hypothetical protein